MKVALIWAMDKNRTIGLNNTLPWRLSNDLKHFKRVTMGKPVIMGRNTWDSLGRTLPGRPNIVISRTSHPDHEQVFWVTSLDAALEKAEQWLKDKEEDEAIVMGGAQIYSLAFPIADRLYITEVQAEVAGDTLIEKFDLSGFNKTNQVEYSASESDDYAFSVMQFDHK